MCVFEWSNGMACSCFPNGEGRHPLFLFMAVTSEEGIEKGVHVPSYLGVSRNPLKRIEELNGTEGFPPANRVAKKGAPYWTPKLVIGPFIQGARHLADDWSNRSRKISCRIVFAIQMVCRINTCLEKKLSAAEMLKQVGCIPQRKVVVWTPDKTELESLLKDSKVKSRKRPRGA